MPTPLNSTRLASADLLKAVSIVAVVFIHAALVFPLMAPSPEQAARLEPALYINTWVTPSLRFCVPVFIILWAYFAESSLQKQNSDYAYLGKRFYKLLIPFLFWSSIYFVLIADFHKLTFTSLITKHWSGNGWSGQYYFIILFQLIPLFIILRRISHFTDRFFIATILLSAVFYAVIAHCWWFGTATVEKVGDRPFLYWLPYVFIGIAYAKKGVKNSLSVSLSVTAALVAICLIPLESFVSSHTSLTLYRMSEYMKPSVFITSVVLVYLLLGKPVFYQQLKPWLATGVGLLARNTLGIFCLNPLVVLLIAYVVRFAHLSFYFPGCWVIIPILSVTLVIGTCIAAINLIKRLKLGLLVAS